MTLPRPSYAFVTLLTSDSYLPGALVLAHSLRVLHPASQNEIPFKLVCMVTPETVSAASIKRLRSVWDLVIGIEILEGKALKEGEGLHLLGRPDLHATITKLHAFRLTPFTKLIFLDADVLPLRPMSHLFALPHPFSAAPDTGWPDCFNSGVMVFSPDEAAFDGMRKLACGDGEGGKIEGSFDGGDQGVLNQWFNGEDGRPAWNRISFTYNTTPTAAYTYAPAYKHYGPSISAVHFIGSNKPWSSLEYRQPQPPPAKDAPYDYSSLVDRWFAIYDKFVRPTAGQTVRFDFPETLAAWDADGGVRARAGKGILKQKPRLCLAELKQIAEKGQGAVSLSGWDSLASSGLGAYMSLPLEGRVDLMRASKVVKPKTVTLPKEPSPVPTPQTEPEIQHPTPQHFTDWDATKSAPPTGTGPEHYQMRDGFDQTYHNAWDAGAKESTWNSGGQGSKNWEVPTELRDGRYSQTGKDSDRKLVETVFPWESRQRGTTRVWPKGESPPPTHPKNKPQQPQKKPPHNLPPIQTQHRAPPPPQQTTSRTLNFAEAMSGYTNAWDDVPSIQRYANRLSGGDRQVASAPAAALASQVTDGQATPAVRRGRKGGRNFSRSSEHIEHSRDGADGDDEGDEGDESSEGEGGDNHSPDYKKGGGRGGGAGGAGASGGFSGGGSGGGARSGGGGGGSSSHQQQRGTHSRGSSDYRGGQQRSTSTNTNQVDAMSQTDSIPIVHQGVQTPPAYKLTLEDLRELGDPAPSQSVESTPSGVDEARHPPNAGHYFQGAPTSGPKFGTDLDIRGKYLFPRDALMRQSSSESGVSSDAAKTPDEEELPPPPKGKPRATRRWDDSNDISIMKEHNQQTLTRFMRSPEMTPQAA